MTGQMRLTWDNVKFRLHNLGLEGRVIYGIPRGGAILAGMLHMNGSEATNDPGKAHIILDDIVDSGSTRDKIMAQYPGKRFVALVDKPKEHFIGTWVKFPWEHDKETDLEDHVRRIIEAIGDDPSREGLLETPRRLVKSWEEIFSGYQEDPNDILKWFSSDADEMVIMRDIQFWSTCEHHMLPFWGTVDIAYIPGGEVIGISKLARVTNAMSRKLQIQENLTQEIGKALDTNGVRGVAVSIKAQHACMIARGVRQEAATLTTNYVSGLFQTEAVTRQEFFSHR